MKARIGFVSNSSSSSFIVEKRALFNPPYPSVDLPKDIRSFYESNAKKGREGGYLGVEYNPIFTQEEADQFYIDLFQDSEYDGSWNIVEHRGYVIFVTSMDNFDMKSYLNKKVGRGVHLTLDIDPHSPLDSGRIDILKKMIDVGLDG